MVTNVTLLQETQALDALIGDVEGERYSCYASHILEKEDPTAQAPTLTAAEKKKVADCGNLYNILCSSKFHF